MRDSEKVDLVIIGVIILTVLAAACLCVLRAQHESKELGTLMLPPGSQARTPLLLGGLSWGTTAGGKFLGGSFDFQGRPLQGSQSGSQFVLGCMLRGKGAARFNPGERS